METFAYSNWFKKVGMPGRKCPIATPRTMQRKTHSERYLEKKFRLFWDISSSFHDLNMRRS
jgi:hypothetical protein